MKPHSLRILRLAPVLDFGGVESRFVMQSREWNAPNIDVHYACFWKDGAAAESIRKAGRKVVVLGEDPSVRNPRATRALLKELRRGRYDIVHASIGEANFHAMLCAPFGPWKTIIEEAGIPNRRLRNRLIHGALYRLPDKIVCVSQASADNIVQNEWAPEEKILVIPNAIDAKYFDVAEHRKPDRKLFRAVGRLTPVKNFDGLLHAFAEARKQVPDIRLELIGEGEERGRLEALVQELALDDVVTLPGFFENIDELHRTTGWLLMPSHREGFGLVAAEAMAAGVPVVSSLAGGLVDVVGDALSAWSASPEATRRWTKLIVDASQLSQLDYQKLSMNVSQRARLFHPDRYIDSLEQLYIQIV